VSEYVVIYEPAPGGGWGAYVPDLPGLGVVGDSREHAEQLIREGIVFHIDGLRAGGDPVPPPSSVAGRIQVAA